jgi:hypothetical protein
MAPLSQFISSLFSVLVCYVPKTTWLKTKEIYSFRVIEVTISKPR